MTATSPARLRTLVLGAALLGTGLVSRADTTPPETALFKAPQPAARTPVPLFVPAEYPMPGAPAPGTYAMRCWQRGRLLFTESNLTEAVVSAIPNKVAAFTEKGARVDPGSATLYVVEVANSLCVIKRS
jgi:hypothetical protein